MKHARRMDSTSQSCSCTSCIYKSESEQPSIRKYVAHGSRIDRLYYGNYIPLRERKLLNRLVRTRAVYDDLRARLISDSTLSLEKNADLRPGKHNKVIKTLDPEKSGAILELVDIIDKGAALGPKKLSDCCSCCSCSSKSKTLDRGKKEQRRKGAYARRKEEEYGGTGQIGMGEGVFVRTYEREYGENIPGRTGERYNKRAVRFKAKHIRSDPCTCTFKFSGLIKKHSKAIYKKSRPLPFEEPFIDTEEQYLVDKTKKQNIARKSFQKYKNLQNKLGQDIKKLNESRANIKQNLQIRAKKSLEQGKQVKKKIKNNIETGVRKSIQAVKGLHLKDKEFESAEYPDLETSFKIKKDSILKFKDYLKRKEKMKDWECDLECEPDICVPEECFKIIKMKRLHKPNRQRGRKYAAGYEMYNREVKVGGTPLSRSNSGVQTDQFAVNSATHIKKHTPILRAQGKKRHNEERLVFESKNVNKGVMKKGINKRVETSSESSLVPAIQANNTFHNIKKKDHIHRKHEKLKEKERFIKMDEHHSRGRQAVRIKSSFSFDVEFSKKPTQPKMSRPKQPAGIHMHAPRHKRRKVHRHHEELHALSKSSSQSSQVIPENVKTTLIPTDKYDKAKKTEEKQLISKISQCACENRLSNVKTNTNYDTKSVSSLTNKPIVPKTDKNISKEVKQKGRLSQVSLLPARLETLPSAINEFRTNSQHKQAVRIGSTFSFNVEFYKNTGQYELKGPTVEKKVKQSRSINRHVVTRKLVQVKGTSAKAYNQAKTSLRRCFCTLKLHGRKDKKKIKTSKTATVMCLCETNEMPPMIDEYVETKKNNTYETKLYPLLPYECEPGVCIPGECDPVLCKKILEMRKDRQRINKSIGSNTGSRKTKSTSSIVSRPFISAKAKTVQSSIVPTKVGRTRAPRRYKDNLKLGRKELIKTNINVSGRQAVRIGSSFSFNIEFYKDKQNPVVVVPNKLSSSSMPPRIKYKQKKFRDQAENKRDKSMFTQIINMEKFIGPSVKRCLCTLKLYKNKVPRKKTSKKTTNLTVNTQTFGDALIGESVDKSTKTKKEHYYKLLPYECEPYFCVPGECDPYICLQKIKRRNLYTRNISAYTDKPEMRSISSFTENSFKKSEAVLVQPKLYPKGTNMKAEYIKVKDGKVKPSGKAFRRSKGKQAVRIGSSFNFNIEFTKQQPGPVTVTTVPKNKESSNVRQNIDKHKGIKVTKVRVDHVDTQAAEPKKINRASLVRPMLKRCFCTLNLQKISKQQYRKDSRTRSNYFGPKVFTIGRAATTKTEIISQSFESYINTNIQHIEPKNKIISISTSSFLLNKYVESLKSKYEAFNLYSSSKIPTQSKQPVIIKSNLSMKIDIIRQLGTSKNCGLYHIHQPLETSCHVCKNVKSHECLKLFSDPSDQSLKKIADISRYLERCFCTMNVQIPNRGDTLGLKKIKNKLKPYECEPGICIPGECDPHECKKLIMRRLAKNVQNSSDTKSTNKSISKNATNIGESDVRGKQIQEHARVNSLVPQESPQKYETLRLRQPKQRRAVLIKSSFSFDLEFYKYRSQPLTKYINQHENSTQIRKPINETIYKNVSIGTHKKKFLSGGGIRSLDSPSVVQEHIPQNQQIQTKHPKISQLEPIKSITHKDTATITKRCSCTLKLQKKGRIHREYAKLSNVPIKKPPSTTSRNVKIGTTTKYHKIPNDSKDLKFYECEPGICVPGRCDPYKCLELMKHRKDLGINIKEKISNLSGTNELYLKEKYKNRAVSTTPKIKRHKSTKTMKYIEDIENNNSSISGRSSRPAVRISSSFSFNIDFLKDIPHGTLPKDIDLRMVKTSKNNSKQKRNREEIKPIFPPSSKSVSHKVIETEKPIDLRTVKLSKSDLTQKKNKKEIKPIFSPTIKNVTYKETEKPTDLKVVKTSRSDLRQKKNREGVKALNSPSRKSVSHKVTETEQPFNQKLIITASFIKRCFCTEKLRSIEVSDHPNTKTFKHKCLCLLGLRSKGNKKNQATENLSLQGKENKVYKQIQKPDIQNKGNKNDQLVEKHVQTSNKPTNINYKHKAYIPNLEPYECEPGICVPGQCDPYVCEKIIQQRIVKQHSKKSETESFPTQSPYSTFQNNKQSKNERIQVQVQDQMLQKQTQYQSKQAQDQINKKQIQDQSKETQGQILQQQIHNQSKEAQGQIRQKQIQNQFKETRSQIHQKKIQYQSKKDQDQIHQKQIQYQSDPLPSLKKNILNADKRLVRIGSNFSFNIEFYKENMDGSEKKEKAREIKAYTTENSQSTGTAKGNITKSIGIETPKKLFLSNIQPAIRKKTKTAGIRPLLKRCFCSFKLNNKPNDQIDQIKKEVNKSDTKPMLTMKSIEKQSNKNALLQIDTGGLVLSPYECEPFVCIPGECKPVECLKRIKKRQQQTKESSTITKYTKKKSVGNITTRMKDKNFQVKHPSPVPYKDALKTSYTDKTGLEKSFNRTRQAVRIGSNFSFDIEFFKDIEKNLPKKVTHRPFEEVVNIQKNSKKSLQNHTEKQPLNVKRNIDSSDTAVVCVNKKNLIRNENTSMKIHFDKAKSNNSSVGDFLKKCMCTLKLNKVGKQQKQPPTPAVKYEIKGTSTHNRGISQDLGKILNQGRQVRDTGTNYKRNVKDSATDSIKQPQKTTKSTKVQYHQNGNFNTRGTSLASKRERWNKETAQLSSLTSHNTNKQVVRIGSNFSFNIEFFKNYVTPHTERGDDIKNKLEKVRNNKKLYLKRPENSKTKSIRSTNTVKRLREKYSQFSNPKTQALNPVPNTAPKRCFCSINMLKKPNHLKSEEKSLLSTKTTKDKTTATKIKYTIPQELGIYECPPLMCIPGECNPYECLEKIKGREVMHKSHNMGPRAARISKPSVGNRALRLKAHKVESEIMKSNNIIVSTFHPEPQSEMLKSSPVIASLDRRNKGAVRIGSNFNFNVEFFKQKSQPAMISIHKKAKTRNNKEDAKSCVNKNVTAGARNFQRYNSRIADTQLKHQASDNGNLLKRCFCTLQLQKHNYPKMAQVKIHRPGNSTRYPQTFTIGRVAVEPFFNPLTKTLKNTDKAQSTFIHSKLLNRSVGTKTNEKYLHNIEFTSSQCNPSNCPDYNKIFYKKNTQNNMQTILPYTPSKFNKKESKTFVMDKNKFTKNRAATTQLKGESANKPDDISMPGKGKRKLTAKKSNKSIPTDSIETKPNFNDSFFCRCIRFFSRRSETRSEVYNKQENIIQFDKQPKQSRSIRRPANINLKIPPKKAKSFSENCSFICSKNDNAKRKTYSKLQSGDAEKIKLKMDTKQGTFNNNQSISERGRNHDSKHSPVRVTFADTSEHSKNNIHKRKTNKSMHSKSAPPSTLCYSCSVNDCPLKFNDLKDDKQISRDYISLGKGIKIKKKSVSYSESADDCQYCSCCKKKVDTDEISKGGGDRRLKMLPQSKVDTDTCPCGNEPIVSNERKLAVPEKSKADKLSKQKSVKENKRSKIKPVLEMRLDSLDHIIINKSEVQKKIDQLCNINKQKDLKFNQIKSKHGVICVCCKCLKKHKMEVVKEKKQNSPKAPRRSNDMPGTIGKLFSAKKIVPTKPRPGRRTKPPRKYRDPCICGSKKCKTASTREIRGKLEKEKPKLGKTCICGSSICRTESKRLKKNKERIVNKAKKRVQSFINAKERKEIKRRLKIQEGKDEIRRRKRIKHNKKLEERVKKYKDASDVMLAVDSLLDIGKLGASTLSGLLRFSTKTIADPKVACKKICKKCRKKERDSLISELQKDYMESDTASTLRRLKMRCLFMKGVQSLRQRLEENRFTHFIMHLADKSAKTRRFKRKPVRRIREPLDFQCSLYMATLRKRPYLSVYYRWPRFYPHFMTMLNIWRQFTDIMLFLLAAVVWSPCILCMEGCRALMCCFFCTG